MKNKVHKIAAKHGYKSNKDFYKDFPTKEAYEKYCMGGKVKYDLGGQIGSLVGAGIGTIIAPGVGTGIGATLGGNVGNLIESGINGSKNVGIPQAHLNPVTNINPYGEQMANGGLTGNISIDIEKGEGLIQPNNKEGYDIIADYANPKRYKAHATNQTNENPGNFVKAPEGSIVVPKKNWKQFQGATDVGKRSIVQNILNDQMKRQQSGKYGRGGYIKAEDGYVDGQLPDFTDPYALQNWLTLNSTTLPTAQNYTSSSNDAVPELDFNNPEKTMMGTIAGGYTGPSTTTSTTTSTTQGNWKDLVPYASDAFQFVGALTKDKVHQTTVPDVASPYLEQLPTKYDISAPLYANQQAFRAKLKSDRSNLQNPTSNAVAANDFGASLNASNDLYGTKINAENQLKTNKLGALAQNKQGIAGQNASLKAQYFDTLLQQSAARRTILNSSVAEAATKYQQQQQFKNNMNIISNLGTYFTIVDGKVVPKPGLDISSLLFPDYLTNTKTSK